MGEKGDSASLSRPGDGNRSGLTNRDIESEKDDEHWFDRENNDDKDNNNSPLSHKRKNDSTVRGKYEDKDITDLKMVSKNILLHKYCRIEYILLHFI